MPTQNSVQCANTYIQHAVYQNMYSSLTTGLHGQELAQRSEITKWVRLEMTSSADVLRQIDRENACLHT
jgi:hypothetical protein